jgi:hypothetical protein
MADPTQFTFSLAEATEALIKKQGIREGKWMLALEFTVNVGIMGTNPTDGRPGAMVLTNAIQLLKAPETGVPSALIVDAAKLAGSETKKR